MIEICDLQINFSGRVIFSNFSLTVHTGEHVAVKGKSGSGKSSILHAVMGFIKRESGKIIINGRELTPATVNDIRREISWLPAEPFSWNGAVRDELIGILSFRSNRGLKPDELHILNVMKQFGLDEYVYNSKLEELSSGQKQRLGMVVIKLIPRPIVLLDEPVSALDAENRSILTGAVNDLTMDNVTIISVSHDENWLRVADRVVEI